MKWLWGSLYAAYWLPFAYFIAAPILALRAASNDPDQTCWLDEGFRTGHFLTPIEAAGFEALFWGGILFVVAALVLIIWHRNRRLFLKTALVVLPLAITFGGAWAMSSAYNEAYFEIFQNHCPNAVSE
ncbi:MULTISPECIES: hypothetical protein [Hyphobacterium]|uniref:Uncharacterized protein n=1 Tax=Hyphobacterium vulgare TaxID=1736751 RepID=A0ABV6ZT21_9PROT